MTRIILTRGLPASGKSTWVREQMDDAIRVGLKAGRVNRDLIRTGLNGSDENVVSVLEEAAVDALVKAKYDVVFIDATHLRPQYIKRWWKKFPDLEVVEFQVTLEEALERNAERLNSVPEDVIRRMYDKYTVKGQFLPWGDWEAPSSKFAPVVYKGDPEWTMPAFIFDIDGTLAHMDGKRSPYEYHKAGGDRLDINVAEVLQRLTEAYAILIVTGREDDSRDVTVDWLFRNGIVYDELHMRKSGDHRKDSIVKYEILQKLVSKGYDIRGVFDDRPQVCRMWHEAGLTLFRVGNPDADF